MKRLNIVKEARSIHVGVSLLLILSGVFLIVWPEVGKTVARYLIGGNFIFIGLARALGYFANDLYRLAFQYDLALGGFCVIFGILLIISPDHVQTALPYIIGVYVLINSLLKMQTALDAKAFGMKHWWGLLAAAVAISTVAVALLILYTQIYSHLLVPIALILDGGDGIWNTLGTVRVRAKKDGRFEDLF